MKYPPVASCTPLMLQSMRSAIRERKARYRAFWLYYGPCYASFSILMVLLVRCFVLKSL